MMVPDSRGAPSDRNPLALLTRPPTILQVLPALLTGGVERGTVDVAAAVAAAGGRSLVASSGGPMTAELEASGVPHLTLPAASKNPAMIAANALRLAALIRRERVNIVHARSRAPAWSALLAARRTGARFVTTFHGVYGARSEAKRLYNAVMARGRPVIAVSAFVAAHIQAVYGVTADRIRVIHRGIDLDRFDPAGVAPERVARLRRSWGVPEGARTIMLPGRLTRWKGQTVLIEAVARLARRDVYCLLVGADQGRTHYRRELEALAAEMGVADRIRLTGDCDDMPAAYMLADLVVSASIDPEAFGRIIAEAQAMGRPVLASAHGAAPEIVADGETGFLYPPGDADALAAAVGRALDLDAAEYRAMASAATARARSRFAKTRMCAATLAVYAEVMRSR